MPIVLRTRTRRLTNDQHRVEVAAHDVSVEQSLSLSLSETLDAADAKKAADDDAPQAPASDTLTYDVTLRFESTDVEDTGYSVPPDDVREDFPKPGTKCIVWRGFRIGEKRHFLMKRTKKGAYTVEIEAEAHLRIVLGGATETVTFPPTP